MLGRIFCLFQCSRNIRWSGWFGQVVTRDNMQANLYISSWFDFFLHFIMFKAASPAYFGPKFGRNVWKDSDCHLSLLDMSLQWLLEIKNWKTSHCALKYQRQILHYVVDLCNMNLQLHCSTAEILYIRGSEGSTNPAYSSCFYFRISWNGRTLLFHNHSYCLLQGPILSINIYEILR